MTLALLTSVLTPIVALAASSSVKLTTYNASQNSIYIEYALEGSADGIDAICVILDYDYTDGFYQVAPQANSRRQVNCNGNMKNSYYFQGLESNTNYWLSIYAYKMGGQGFILPSGGGSGVAGKEIKTKQADVTFSAIASDITAYSVTLSTPRPPDIDEYYGASCSPYTGREESDGFIRMSSVVVGHLQPNTRYTCRIYVYPSSSGGNTQGVSSDVVFTTLAASQSQNPPPTIPSSRPQSTFPPAGYEDEVLTNFSAYSNPFPDTNLNELSGKSAAELYRRSVIGGFPDGQFKGDRSVNRAEAAKFLLLARYGIIAEVNNNGRFPDVLDNQWYTRFVVTAADKGIIKGHPNGLFKPGDQVNTAEFLKMFSLTFGLPLNMTYRYNDVPSDSWFAPYAGIAQKYNLFPSRSSLLLPETPLSRTEVAIAIYQYLSQRLGSDELKAYCDKTYNFCYDIPNQSAQKRFSFRLPSGASARGNTGQYNLPITQGTTLHEKYLIITEGHNEVLCVNADNSFKVDSAENSIMNGIQYRKETGRSSAMQSTYEYVRYTTLYPNYSGSICASLTFVLRYVNQEVFENPPPLYNKAKEESVFDEIMKSVHFE